MIPLFYMGPHGSRVPLNYRIYDKTEGKSKNDYFLEMLDEVLQWGLKSIRVTGDAWYSSLKNLEHVRKNELNSLFGIDGNRLILIKKGSYIQIPIVRCVSKGRDHCLPERIWQRSSI